MYGIAQPVPLRKAVELGKRGRPKRGQEKGDGISLKTQFGTSADYLTARIRRDAAEIAARMGEYGSVAKAARAALIPPAALRRNCPKLGQFFVNQPGPLRSHALQQPLGAANRHGDVRGRAC